MLSFKLPDVVTIGRHSGHSFILTQTCETWHASLDVADVVRLKYLEERSRRHFLRSYTFLLIGNLKAIRRELLAQEPAPLTQTDDDKYKRLCASSRSLWATIEPLRRAAGLPPIRYDDATAAFRTQHDAQRQQDTHKAHVAALTRLIDALVSDKQRLQTSRFTLSESDLFASMWGDWTPNTRRLAAAYTRIVTRPLRRGTTHRRTYWPEIIHDDDIIKTICARRLLPFAASRLRCLAYTSDDEKQAALIALSSFIDTFRFPQPALA